jgi:peptide/nickel transport system substrate-binding protein
MSTDDPIYGGIIILTHQEDPPVGWDRMRAATSRIGRVAGSMFGMGNLVKNCREDVYTVCPGVAESWETNSDFTEWTFKIKDNMLWHDGTPATAEDAKFWVDLAAFGARNGDKVRAPAHYHGVLGDPKKVEVLSGNRLRITLPKGAPLYPEAISNPRYSFQHPKHLMEPFIKAGEVGVAPIDVGLVGLGPFTFKSYDKGSRIQVRRFDRYWEKDDAGRQLPFLDGIDFAIIKDKAAMDAAFRTRKVDGGSHTGGGYLDRERRQLIVKTLGDKVWFAELYNNAGGFAFNTLKEGPWQDVRVRKAMSLWIDRDAGIALGSEVSDFYSPIFPPGSPFTNPGYEKWPGWNPATKAVDRAEAKRLMAEAGYASGFQMAIVCAQKGGPENCLYYQEQLRGLGIDMEIQMLDNASWAAAFTSLDYDVIGRGGSSGSTSPEGTEKDLTRYSISSTSTAKHEDQKVAAFYDQLRGASDVQQRISIWRDLAEYYLKDQVYSVICCGTIQVIPYRTYVKGYQVPTFDAHNSVDYATTWMDK